MTDATTEPFEALSIELDLVTDAVADFSADQPSYVTPPPPPIDSAGRRAFEPATNIWAVGCDLRNMLGEVNAMKGTV